MVLAIILGLFLFRPISYGQRSGVYESEVHKRVTLTDAHVRDAAQGGGSVNEGRIVKPLHRLPYSHKNDDVDDYDGRWYDES